MSKINLKIGKRIVSVLTTASVVAGLMVSASAYGITVPEEGSFTYDGTQTSVTVPVTGTTTSGQVTIVVRKDGDNWLTDPNSNVIYIDQVTGAEGSTSITFGIDEKWLSAPGEYKIFVGGSSQAVTSASLFIGDDIEKMQKPEGVEEGATYYTAPTAYIEVNDNYTIAVSKNGGAFENVTLSNGSYTFNEDGAYVIKAVDLTAAKADSSTVSFTVEAAAVAEYIASVQAIKGQSSWSAADVATIDTLIAEYEGFVAAKQEAITATLGADFIETLNNIKTQAVETALADVYAQIDALPDPAEVTEGDADIQAAVDAIDAAVAALEEEWGSLSSYVAAYADGKLAAVKSALKGGSTAEDVVVSGSVDTAFDQEGKSVVTATLAEGSGSKKIMVGDAELFYSIERDLYVGIIDSANISGTTLNNVVITDEAPTIFVYGNVDASSVDTEDPTASIKNSDLLQMKLYLSRAKTFEAINLIASDVTGDGRVVNSDLLQLKIFLGTRKPFAIISK